MKLITQSMMLPKVARRLKNIVTVTVGSIVTNSAQPALSGTVSDPAATINVNWLGTDYAATNNGNGTWTLLANTVSAASNGQTVQIVVTATDASLNVGTGYGQATIDTAAPVITRGSFITSLKSPKIEGQIDQQSTSIKVTSLGVDYYPAPSVWNGSDYTWTIPAGTIADLPEGITGVTVYATDTAGNTASLPVSVWVDSVAPVVTVNSVVTKQPAFTVSGTCFPSTDSMDKLTVNGTDVYPAITNLGSGNWSKVNVALTEGANSIVAQSIPDFGGNIGYGSGTVTLDTVAPIVTISSLTTKNVSPPLSGLVDDIAATIEVTVNATPYAATNNGDGTWILDGGTITLNEGSNSISVTATDVATNVGSDSGTATLDTNAPAVTVDSLVTKDSTPAITGTIDDPDATLSLTIAGNVYVPVNNGNNTWTLADNTISPALAAGSGTSHTVDITATDAVGNTAQASGSVFVDTFLPLISYSLLLDTVKSPRIYGKIDQSDTTVIVNVGGTDYAASAPVFNGTNYDWEVAQGTVANLPEGLSVVTVKATDTAGNYSSVNGQIYIDSIPPEITINSITTNDTTPVLGGTVNDNAATITVTIGGTDYVGTVLPGGATWSYQVEVPLTEGVTGVGVKATDPFGNVSDVSNGSVTVDTTAPSVSVSSFSTNDTTPAITGTVDDPAATISVTIGGNSYSATNNGNNTWTLADNTIVALPDGNNAVSVTATDAVGNVGNGAGTITVDTVAPVITVDPLYTSDATPEITGTVDDTAATIVVTANSIQYAATNNGDGTWTLADNSIAALNTGVNVVMAAATDTFGNVGYGGNDITIVSGETIPDLLFSADLTSSLAATGYGAPTAGGTSPDVSAKGVLIESAGNNWVYRSEPRQSSAWYVISGVTYQDAYEANPFGRTGIRLQNNTGSAAQGISLIDIHTMDGTAKPMIVKMLVKNDDVSPTARFRVVVFGALGNQALWEVYYDKVNEPFVPGQILWTTSRGTNGGAEAFYVGDGYYQFNFKFTSAADIDTLKLQMHVDRTNSNGAAIVGDVSLAIDETQNSLLIPTSTSALTATNRIADTLYYTNHGLQSNDMSGTFTFEMNVVPETAYEVPLFWCGNKANWKDPTASGFGVFVDEDSVTFRKVQNGNPVSGSACWFNIVGAGSVVGSMPVGSTFTIGWRMSSTTGTELWINGVQYMTNVNTSDVAIGNLWIGSDGSSYSNCTIRNFKVYYEGDGVPSGPPVTDTFLDLTAGVNGDGATEGSPFNTLSSIVWADNMRLRFARGKVHRLGTAWQGIHVGVGCTDGLEITDYGTDPNPAVLTGAVATVAGDWTAQGGGVYLYTGSQGLSQAGVVLYNNAALNYLEWQPEQEAANIAAMTEGSYLLDTGENIGGGGTVGNRIWVKLPGLVAPNVGNTVEISICAQALSTTNHSAGAPLRNLKVNKIEWRGFSRNGGNLTNVIGAEVYNNTVHSCGGDWNDTQNYPVGGGFQVSVGSSNIVYDGNIIYDVFDSPLSPQLYAPDGTIDGVIFRNNDLSKGALAGIECTIWSTNCHINNILVENNTIYGMGLGFAGLGDERRHSDNTDGVLFKNGNNAGSSMSNIVVQKNIIYDCDHAAINAQNVTTDDKIVIARNTCRNSRYGVRVNTSNTYNMSVDVTHNLIYDNTVAGIYHNTPNTSGSSLYQKNTVVDNGPDNIHIDSANATVRDNICYGANYGIRKSGGGTVVESHNLAFGASVANFSGITAGTGSQQIDPQFTDYSGNNFQPTSALTMTGSGTATGSDILSRAYIFDNPGCYRV